MQKRETQTPQKQANVKTMYSFVFVLLLISVVQMPFTALFRFCCCHLTSIEISQW